jgi:hypothetical protein
MYDAGNTRQRDGDAKRTKKFVFFFNIGAACVQYTSLFSIYIFFATRNLGLKLLGPIWRPTPDVLRGVARGAG